MKISIVTVVRNRVSTIRNAIESVSRQLVDGFELEYIVVDGASSDGTVDVIRSSEPLFAHISAFRWVSERDRGLYDAINKGIRMASGDVIGLLHSDDKFDADNVLKKVAEAFASETEAIYGDVRFVETEDGPTVRYCTGKYFRPWMFRFGTQVAHPSFFCRKKCFETFGYYSTDYGPYGDFELLLRFIWKNGIKARYVPLCTTIMMIGGASTGSLKKTIGINKTDLRILRDHGYYSNSLFLYSRYLFKIWGFVFRRLNSNRVKSAR